MRRLVHSELVKVTTTARWWWPSLGVLAATALALAANTAPIRRTRAWRRSPPPAGSTPRAGSSGCCWSCWPAAAVLVGTLSYLLSVSVVGLVFDLVHTEVIREDWVLRSQVVFPAIASLAMTTPPTGVWPGEVPQWVGAAVLLATASARPGPVRC